MQSAARHVSGDAEYRSAGHSVEPHLADCLIIVGLKKIPVDVLEEDKA